MSEQPKPPFFSTKQDEIDYWKRRYHDEKRFTSTIQQELEHQRTKYSKLLSYSGRNEKLFDELFDSAEKAEAALESAQKMSDHWEKKAAERQQPILRWMALATEAWVKRDDWKARAEKAEAERDELKRKLSDSEDEKLDLVKLSCVDWQRVRIDAAIAAMQGMLACRGGGDAIARSEIATEYADALVTELQKKEVQG